MSDHPLGLDTVRWFGRDWGGDVCKPETHLETPIGRRCQCGHPIGPDDIGLRIRYIGGDDDGGDDDGFTYVHHACFMENILGPGWKHLAPPPS